jgi:hypothetical protein
MTTRTSKDTPCQVSTALLQPQDSMANNHHHNSSSNNNKDIRRSNTVELLKDINLSNGIFLHTRINLVLSRASNRRYRVSGEVNRDSRHNNKDILQDNKVRMVVRVSIRPKVVRSNGTSRVRLELKSNGRGPVKILPNTLGGEVGTRCL